MTKKIKLYLLACRIEWHWLFIIPGRKKGSRIIDELLAKGLPMDSPKMMSINKRLNRHCTRVTVLAEKYNELAGIRIFS